jgi:hypothetical protein
MFRAIVVIATLASVAAFAPAGRSVKNAISMEIDLIGASAPVGFFDPAGLSKGKDAETLAWYRAAELKHGRICMLASLGIIVQGYNAGVSIPNPAFTEPNAMKALGVVAAGNPAGLVQILLAISAVEVLTASIANKSERPGDFGWDPLNIRPKSAEALDTMQLKELKNGRLAMLATAGMALATYQTGLGTVEQFSSF